LDCELAFYNALKATFGYNLMIKACFFHLKVS
jgi:hypothetical protein